MRAQMPGKTGTRSRRSGASSGATITNGANASVAVKKRAFFSLALSSHAGFATPLIDQRYVYVLAFVQTLLETIGRAGLDHLVFGMGEQAIRRWRS
ncbi:hypothetical protein [Candidatus Accumulibacter phosphatis]